MNRKFPLQTLALGLLLVHVATEVSAGNVRRVSVRASGGQANAASALPAISADARFVAFESAASNLVKPDTNNITDIFVRDRETNKITRVNVGTNGVEAKLVSGGAAISGDGHVVAFWSSADTLASDDTNQQPDVFVHDLQSNTTTKISVSSGGDQGNDSSSGPALSQDGNLVAFHSLATNLVDNDINQKQDVFVRDRQGLETTLVSTDSNGVQGNGDSYSATVSADGRLVAFASEASNLVEDDTNEVSDVFVHDRTSGQTTRISINAQGKEGKAASDNPVISADGNYVAFTSAAPNLAAGDENGQTNTFLRDLRAGVTYRVSIPSLGLAGAGESTGEKPSISSDGRYVAFTSASSSLVSKDTNGQSDVFVHDRITGETTKLSVPTPGGKSNLASHYPVLSSNGQYAAFHSAASNLVPRDTNGSDDVFIYNRFAKGNLGIKVVANKTLIEKGRPIRYDITAVNHSTKAVSGVRLTDVLPTSLEFGSASGNCLYDQETRTVTCFLGMLRAGASKPTFIRLIGSRVSVIANTIRIDGDLEDVNPGNNTRTVTVSVQ